MRHLAIFILSLIISTAAQASDSDSTRGTPSPFTYNLYFTGHGSDVITGPGGGIGVNYYPSDWAFVRVNAMLHWDYLKSEAKQKKSWRATHLSIPLEFALAATMYGDRSFKLYAYSGPVLQYAIAQRGIYPGEYSDMRVGASMGVGVTIAGFTMDVGTVLTKQYSPDWRVMMCWEFL